MVLAESKLRVGVIYGDPANHEYVYMPGSELGVKDPVCVYEETACAKTSTCTRPCASSACGASSQPATPSGERAPAERRRKDTCCNRVLLHVSFCI